MSDFGRRIRPHVDAELALAHRTSPRAAPLPPSRISSAAHVFGQASTAQHVRVHWQMFLLGTQASQRWRVPGSIAAHRWGGHEDSRRPGPLREHRRCQCQSVQAHARAPDLEQAIRQAHSVDS